MNLKEHFITAIKKRVINKLIAEKANANTLLIESQQIDHLKYCIEILDQLSAEVLKEAIKDYEEYLIFGNGDVLNCVRRGVHSFTSQLLNVNFQFDTPRVQDQTAEDKFNFEFLDERIFFANRIYQFYKKQLMEVWSSSDDINVFRRQLTKVLRSVVMQLRKYLETNLTKQQNF